MKRFLWALPLVLILLGSAPTTNRSVLPPGYVLVAGKDSMWPFLISENPVSNFEYLLYIEWLKKIYIDYPEVYKKAKPQSNNPDIGIPMNEPYTNAYFGHPAYADYPVVGVNWLQAMEFCSWKMDRLNEAMLVEMGGLNWEKQLSTSWNENNFNTEAYLNGQYNFYSQPIKNKAFFHFKKSGKNGEWEKPDIYSTSDKTNSSDLFPEMFYGARLPSEDEWDYYMLNASKKMSWFAESSYNNIADYVGISEGMKNAYGKNRNYAAGASLSNKNIREWLLDTFTHAVIKYHNSVSRFAAAGLHMANVPPNFMDQYGSLREKDSMGRFGFRIMGWEPSGEAMCTWRYGYKSYTYFYDILLGSKSSFADSVVAIYFEKKLDSLRTFYRDNMPQIVLGEKGMLSGLTWWFVLNEIKYYVNLPYPFQSVEFDIQYLKSTAQYVYNMRTECAGCEFGTSINRITKNKEKRKSEPEIYGQNDIGFRVLIPWYGNSLKKPIKW